jgi:hypothetical protein
MRLPFAAALLGAALVLAPPASAQDAPSFLTTVGSPLPYRIDLPRDWEITRQSETRKHGEVYTLAAGNGSLMASLTASDLVETDDAVERQATDSTASSDSFLREAMRRTSARWRKTGEVSDLVQEIRTLSGQRAIYIRCRIVHDGKPHRLEMYMTVRDGIAYRLVTMAEGEDYAAHEPLFARIRDSLVLGHASAGSREAR